jgi:hypothetical protein
MTRGQWGSAHRSSHAIGIICQTEGRAMRRRALAVSPFVAFLITLAASSGTADARVLISSFRFKVCVTGAKHPDGCKDVSADARVTVSDETMDVLDGEIGQGATITAIPDKGMAPASGAPERRRRHMQQ